MLNESIQTIPCLSPIMLQQIIQDHASDEPFFIVNLTDITSAFQRWQHNLPDITAYYAMKCNPNPVILKHLKQLGCHFDCASKTELEEIMTLCNDSKKIIFAHPCKYPSHISYAKENKIDLMTFDSEDELRKIKLHHPAAELLLRLAVDDSQSLCKFNNKFGCKEHDIDELIFISKELGLNLVGFSFHVGSACSSAYTYYDAIRICSKAKDIAESHGIVIKIIDIGGGFVAHYDDVHITFEDIANKIKEGQQDFFGDSLHDIKFIAEPGRFLVQTSHTLVCCIVAKKRHNEKFIYYLNDGIYGSFNCIIFDHQNPEIIPINPKNTGKTYESQIFGNTCDSLDEIKKNVLLPELFINDYVYIKNFGAYTTSAKSDGFNGYKVNDFKYIYTEG
jgi:ornithine decarboxylase